LTEGVIVVGVLVFLAIIILAKTAVVVPQQAAYVVERLGRYSATLQAGFHVLTPFVDVIRYRHSLKETAIDIPEQVCITRDNVQVRVDGLLYLKVLDAERASYGISNYTFAIAQLCQTTLRSEVGKIDLDKTFEERAQINLAVVSEVDKASEPWGVKVLRYEIKNITPPQDILAAMEGPVSLTQCNETQGARCPQESLCPVTDNWKRINHVVRQALSNITLAEMASPLPRFGFGGTRLPPAAVRGS